MGITFDPSAIQDVGASGPNTFSHDFSGDGACVLISSGEALDLPSAVKVGGVSLAKVAQGVYTVGGHRYGVIWALDTGVPSGTQTVEVTCPTTDVRRAVAVDVTSSAGIVAIGDSASDGAASTSTDEVVDSGSVLSRGIAVTCSTTGGGQGTAQTGHTLIGSAVIVATNCMMFATEDADATGSRSVGFTGNGLHAGAVMLWEEVPVDAIAEPARIGEEASFRAGVEVTAPEDGWVFANRMQAEVTAFRSGVLVQANGPRQVALVGRMLGTSEMTEGGTEGQVLTYHDEEKPTWEDAAGGASALDDLTDVDAPTPADGDVLSWDDGAGEWVNTPAGTPGPHTHDAVDVDYDNATSGLTATDVQAAIDELSGGSVPPALRVYLWSSFR